MPFQSITVPEKTAYPPGCVILLLDAVNIERLDGLTIHFQMTTQGIYVKCLSLLFLYQIAK